MSLLTPYDVILGPREYTALVQHGLSRWQDSKAKGLQDRHGLDERVPDEQKFFWEVNGVCAEYAVALVLGIEWHWENGRYKDSDVGANIQVRWASFNSGRLIIRPRDNLDHIYVLTVPAPGRWFGVRIMGWAQGSAAVASRKKALGFKSDERPSAWWIPGDALHRDLDKLKEASRAAGGVA